MAIFIERREKHVSMHLHEPRHQVAARKIQDLSARRRPIAFRRQNSTDLGAFYLDGPIRFGDASRNVDDGNVVQDQQGQ